MKKIFTILFLIISISSFATHERAGEITYRCLGGLTYEISVTTYTKGTSFNADRCSLIVYFGTGDSAIVCRKNSEIGDPLQDPWSATCNNNLDCSTHHMGEWSLGTPSLQSLNIKKNVYTTTYTYPGPGTYVISMTDPNRNDAVINVGTGVQFSIQDTLMINPFILPCNSSPVLKNPPVDKACSGKLFIHNAGAVDPDGDSLSYKLGVCFENVGTPISGYWIPPGVSINPVTGDLTWNVPPPSSNDCQNNPDEYNFAFDIEEWRKIGSSYVKIGTVRRDMQVRVCNCDNHPPVISSVSDTCILANTLLSFSVVAYDTIENSGIQSFTATGGPFSTNPSATFVTQLVPPQTLVRDTGVFSWTPSCNQVRYTPYLVTLKALDDGAPDNVPLAYFKSFFITVIAPAVKNLSVTPVCTSMKLNWNAETCNPSTNPLVKYKIYRKIGCDTLSPGHCERGMPSSWGYSLIATIASSSTSYTDNSGLVHGLTYSYRIVAQFLDGSESYVSSGLCAKLVRDVPIITNVDVISTGTGGAINVKWVKPLADTNNYDTTKLMHHGPYRFDMLRASGYAAPIPPAIASFSSPYFATLNTVSYLDSPLNTQSYPYNYKIDFFDTSNVACPTQNASSVFISCNPSDNRIQLTWNEHVPWVNHRYDVFRKNNISGNWDSLGTTTLQTYTDSGLANGVQFCYKLKSIGTYLDITLPSPLINWSQELCCSAIDNTPPCPLTLSVDSSCDLNENILHWNNPNNSCCNDALYYIIYYTPVQDGEFSVLDTVHNINVTSFLHDSLNSIAGCYAVTSVDSFANQSLYSNIVCVDNCPYYSLPNVFTPNGDGLFDFFTPIEPYKYVKDIDITIYDRWGVQVFHTTNPKILWDGKNEQTKKLCSDGVYFYACVVNDIRLKGIVPRVLKGNVHLLHGK